VTKATKKFTENQQQAIGTNGADICVAAGAGSGKTGVLVERFVRLVTDSKAGRLPPWQCARVDQILVITFTEKATKEMKTRIVAALNDLNLVEERRQVETAYISTIHGFCSRLLQENPFEAGVDPQFSVLDEAQSRRLMRQSFETIVARAYASEETEVTELVAAVQSARQANDEGGEPLSVLAGATESVIAKMRGAGKNLKMVEQHYRDGKEMTGARSLESVWAILTPLLSEISAAVDILQTLRDGVLGTARVAVDAILERAEHLHSGSESLEATIAALEATYQTVGRAMPRQATTPESMELIRLLQRVRIQCEEAKSLFGVLASREENATVACHRLWGLALAVWKEYDTAKRRWGKLDTDDLQEEGLRLLLKSPVVRVRYQRRFRHLMIDEFQDTNPLQMRLINLLHVKEQVAESSKAKLSRNLSHSTDKMAVSTPSVITNGNSAEIVTGMGKPLQEPVKEPGAGPAIRQPVIPFNSLFIVGDVQQSIYGFRHADSSLFQELERRFREENAGTHVALAVNFRSRPEILKTVETVFRQIWRDEPTPFVPLTLGASFSAKSGPSLEALLTQDISRREYVSLEAEALAGRVQRMVEERELTITRQDDPRHGQPVAYRDIAILLRGLTDVQKYEEAFARRGVPCFVVGGGRGYYARHEIRDLLNVLTVLDTPLDDVALAAALRSPLVGADTDTLYHLAQQAKQTAQANKQTNGQTNEHGMPQINTAHSGKRSHAHSPLYPAIFTLLERNILPLTEQEKLRDFVGIMEALRAQEDRLPVGHLLERLITHTHYDARLLCRPGGRRRLANVRKLLQMANSDPVMGVRDFIRRLREMEKLSDREGDAPTEEEAADVTRILTIHGAKGLEFPVVILADLARGLLIPERGLFACDPQRFALGTKLGGEPNVVYKAIDRQRQEADKKEAARLLYVAMTRAREHLILCGNIGRNRSFNWADGLFQLLGLLNAPPEPEVQVLAGGIRAQVASLAYYRQIPNTLAGTPTRAAQIQQSALRDRIADAIATGEPLDTMWDNRW
jgi:ATP-dependent helicase/nuclease subunit A